MIDIEKPMEETPVIETETVQEAVETPAEPDTVATEPEKLEEHKSAPQPDYIETNKERNWREVRRKAEEAEKLARERDELARKIQELEGRRAPATQQEDDDVRLGADELAEGKHLDKVQSKIRKLESKLQEYEQKSTAMAVEVKLKSDYPDFDSVVSKENLAQLQAQYPEVAETLGATTNLYSKAVTAYTMIKRLGIQPDTSFVQDKLQALNNAKKPRPLTSVNPQQGDTPLSHANAFANGLTEDLKKKLWQEMEASIKAS